MKKNKTQLFIKLWKVSLIIVLIFSLFLFFLVHNKKLQALERHVEITFISPHQAIIFWKTDTQSLGYIKVGEKKHRRQTSIYQTSSEASYIHAVLVEEIPNDGLFISLHNEDDPFWYYPTIRQIIYEPEMESEMGLEMELLP